MEPTIAINGSTLRAVPAMHYRAVFAKEVNRLCAHEATRPDAIAVELGVHLVKEIVIWMEEMGFGPSGRIILPCMIGLIAENRLIHPDFRNTVFFLQQRYKEPLRNIDPVILKHFLHFSAKHVVGLSSTDSIIEAIRCAIELGIPVYGIDMDECSMGEEEQLLLEDPSTPAFDLEQYVMQNEKIAARARDPYVDDRRETVMAARLKTILSMHKQVLFTCGLAHWEKIRQLLTSPEIRQADILVPEQQPKISRVLLHPFIALRFMDVYPALSTLYENCRHHPSVHCSESAPLADAGQLIRKILDKTYLKFYDETHQNVLGGSLVPDYGKIPEFERLLSSTRLIAHQGVPSMATLGAVAASIMSTDFSKILFAQLMDIGRPWATPAQFPGLPLISNAPVGISVLKSPVIDQQCQLNEVEQGGDDKGAVCKKKSDPFTVHYRHGNRIGHDVFRHWEWDDEPKEKGGYTYTPAWMWPPCEALLYGTANEAAKMATAHTNETISAQFEGSLYEGLDTRASMRSVIRGENRIYIRKPSFSKTTIIPNGKSPDPTVFLFCSHEEGLQSSWSILVGGLNIGSFVKNKSRFEEVTKKHGSTFFSSIALDHSIKVPQTLKPHVDEMNMLEGITLFGNPCINARQSACWIEDNDYRCCPVTNHSSVSRLIKDYQRLYQMDIDEDDWQTSLIQFAIPFAKERVVVVAPTKYRLSRKLHAEAKRRKISLALLPLTRFPVVKIAEMRKRLSARSTDPDGIIFPRETEIAIGQQADHYRDLLPVYMQNQLIKKD